MRIRAHLGRLPDYSQVQMSSPQFGGRQIGLMCAGAVQLSRPPHWVCKNPCVPRRFVRMTNTDATAADLALAELHEHLAAIARLAHVPFSAERIALHRANALECLDVVAGVLA